MDIKVLLQKIFNEITGNISYKKVQKSKIIKLNTSNLSECGDLYFSSNLLAWKALLSSENDTDNNQKNVKNILEYYLQKNGVNIADYTPKQIVDQACNLLVLNSKSWPITLQKGFLYKEKVILYLNRLSVISNVIKETLKCNKEYGKYVRLSTETSDDVEVTKTIILKLNEDPESDLTTYRLKQLKNICDNILLLQEYVVKNDINIKNNDNIINKDNVDYKYFLTTKSEGRLKEGYIKYICGVVKNSETNSKETKLTYGTYLGNKIKEIEEVNGCRQPGTDHDYSQDQLWVKNYRTIAEAIIIFEFFSVKPSHPVFIKTNLDTDKAIANNKGGSFVLYNKARISAILEKFDEEKLAGRYPELWNIDDVNFEALNLEEEWELIYNFILGYPMVVRNSIELQSRHELSPQIICSFLSHLSQKFSIYYRRSRILTEGRQHLLPTLMARLYLLKALQTVYDNALNVLNITPISRM